MVGVLAGTVRPEKGESCHPGIADSCKRRPLRAPVPHDPILLLSAGLHAEVGRAGFFAGVQNLLDVRYELPVGSEFPVGTVPQYGRTFLLRATVAY